MWDVLASKAENDDASMRLGGIGADVGKVGVKSNEGTLFPLANCEEHWVGSATEVLFSDGGSINTGVSKESRGLNGEILVELELHAARSGGNGENPFTCQIGCIRKSGMDRLPSERGVVLQESVDLDAGGEIIENSENEDASAPKARLAMADLGVDGDVRAPIHAILHEGQILGPLP